jgi:hypothetical protein
MRGKVGDAAELDLERKSVAWWLCCACRGLWCVRIITAVAPLHAADQALHNPNTGKSANVAFASFSSMRSTIRFRTYGSGVARCSSPAGTLSCYDGGATSGRPGKEQDGRAVDLVWNG